MSIVNNISAGIDGAGDGRSARWERHRSERRLDLLALARKAIHHLGPQASMDDIAAHASTSKPVYYRYFGDKEGLRQALSELVIGDFRRQVLAAGKAQQAEAVALHAMVTAYLQLAQSSPNIYFFVTAQPVDALTAPNAVEDDSTRVLGAFFDEVALLISERLTAYAGAAPGNPTPAVALWPRAALGMVRSAGELWLRQVDDPQRPTLEELADALCDWLTHGISSTKPGAQPRQKGSS